MAKQEYYPGTGRRKAAVAQVRLSSGGGAIIINGKPYEEAFPRLEHRLRIMKPFLVTENVGKYNATVKVNGGGISGQADAICHGIARALLGLNESFRKELREFGLLTRDARVKERKKVGLKRARKAPQYTKR